MENIMGMVHDFLASQVGEDGSSTLPDGFSDGILGAYDTDMSSALDGATAATAQRDETIAALTAELQATKAANWDLTQLVGTGDGPTSDPENSENDTDDTENDDTEKTIDDLFGAAN
jgi:hypothetical protein